MMSDTPVTPATSIRPSTAQGLGSRGGSVSMMFGVMAVPLVIMTALAVDYSVYVQAQSQLDVAADAASLQAVRVASSEFIAGVPVSQAETDGQTAGQQWFAAQLGLLSNASVPASNVNVPPVTFNASTGTFTETVSFTGTVPTIIAGAVTSTPNWPIGGSSTATIAANSYAEFEVLVDNSSSMLIGATPTDIINIENLTVCPPTTLVTNGVARTLTEYSWTYPTNVGYGLESDNKTLQTVPTASSVQGSCYSDFTGGSAQCPYPQGMNGNGGSYTYPGVDSAGFCPTGTGQPDPNKRIDPVTKAIGNIPQGPCGFACHQQTANDYYTLVRGSGLKIQLRFDVIQSAMANMVNYIQAAQKITNQFTVGVFQFNSTASQVHPTSSCNTNGTPGGGQGFCEADTNFAQAATDIQGIATPIVPDVPNTNFPGAIQYLASNLTPAGNGGSATSRAKNMFIITDGLQDYQPSGGNRTMGPVTTVNPEPYCSQLKSLGYNVFVLYTPYYPLPNPFYLGNGPRTYVEPTVPPATTNPVIAALQACATNPSQFYQAADTTDINNALALMVQSAIASPASFSN